MRNSIRRFERWLKKRTRVLRGIDCLERPTSVESVLPLGSEYGGWAICPVGIHSDSLVYSLGIGGDTTFDAEIINRFGATVHGFDPCPAPPLSSEEPDRFIFHDYGIAARDGEFLFAPVSDSCSAGSHTIVERDSSDADSPYARSVKMKRLATVMTDLHHEHIDILKMDIEGAEWTVIPDLLQSGILPYQILIEFHHLLLRHVGVEATKETIHLLKQHGYDVFYVSEKGQEYGFIRRDLYAENISKSSTDKTH